MNPPPPLPAPRELLSITYASTRKDHWRCNVYTLFHNKWSGLLMIGCAVLLSFNSPLPAFSSNKLADALWTIGACLAGLLLINFVLLAVLIQMRVRAGKTSTCTSALTPEGVRDVSPEKTRLLPWGKISQIREHKGDVHVWSGIAGVYIPRNAFENTAEAQRFAQLANELWRSKGASWSELSVRNWRADEAPPVCTSLPGKVP